MTDTMTIDKNTFILPNWRTIAETEQLHNERIKAVYAEYWSKGVSPKYQDERCNEATLFVAANQDGSEDLVRFEPETRTYTHIQRLAEAGKGNFLNYISV
jgi:outer membrane receptor for ferric coprogen and ferric-rhodotorulic acid